MNIRMIVVSMLCIAGVMFPLQGEPKSQEGKEPSAQISQKLTTSKEVLNKYFNSVGIWKTSTPEDYSKKKTEKPNAEEIIHTLNTMVRNVEMNKESLDKDAVIRVFRDYTRITERQLGVHRKRRINPVFIASRKKAVPSRPARKQALVKRISSPVKGARIQTKGMMVYGPQAPAGIFGIAVKKHLKEVKPMRSRLGFRGDQAGIEKMIDSIRKQTKVNFVMDNSAIRKGIQEGRVRSTITLKVDNMTFENALNWICRLSGLVWTMKDEAIFITTPERLDRGSENKLKIYDIRDLKAPVPDFPAPGVAFGKDGEGFGGGWGF